jgi:hypothetical protein
MKHLWIFLAICAAAVEAVAQTNATAPLGPVTLGFRAGVNFQNFNGKDQNGDMLNNDLVTRFNAGLNVEIPIAVDFFFQPGLLFTTKGSARETVLNNQPYKSNVSLSYLELPLHLVYKPLLGTGHFILGFGPYVAYGVGGKAKYTIAGMNSTESVKFKNKVEAGDPTNVTYFRPWDAGANLFAGYEFSNKLSFQLNVQLGLVPINPEYPAIANDRASVKNTGFGLSVGYRL